MANLSSYLKDAFIKSSLKGEPFSAPANVYLALFRTDPTEEGTGIEVSGGNYARQEAEFEWVSSGKVRLENDVPFPTPTDDWGRTRWIAVFDDDTAGNMLYYGMLRKAPDIKTGVPFKIKAGELTVSLR